MHGNARSIRGGSRIWSGGAPDRDRPKTAILGPQFCRILVLGPHFWWSGGGGRAPGAPPVYILYDLTKITISINWRFVGCRSHAIVWNIVLTRYQLPVFQLFRTVCFRTVCIYRSRLFYFHQILRNWQVLLKLGILPDLGIIWQEHIVAITAVRTNFFTLKTLQHSTTTRGMMFNWVYCQWNLLCCRHDLRKWTRDSDRPREIPTISENINN